MTPTIAADMTAPSGLTPIAGIQACWKVTPMSAGLFGKMGHGDGLAAAGDADAVGADCSARMPRG